MEQLRGKYAVEFYEIKERIQKGAKPGPEREEATENIHSIFLEAQENGTPLEEIYEGSAEEYANEIISGLPHESQQQKKKRKIIIRALAVIAVLMVLFFTSDRWNMHIGGYNYYEKYRERFYGAPFYFMEDVNVEYHRGKQDPNLASLGIYFDAVRFYDDEHLEVNMRSKTMMQNFGRYQHYYPSIHYGGGQFYTMNSIGDITAEINGILYIGEPMGVDATGRDLRYWISFSPADENVDCSGTKRSFESGEPINFYFEDISRKYWEIKGNIDLLAEGLFPFFVHYKYEPHEENPKTNGDENMRIYQLYTADWNAGAVAWFELNPETGEYELAEKSIPRKMNILIENVEYSKPYIDENMLCVEITVCYENGDKITELVKTEIDDDVLSGGENNAQ